MSRVTTGITTFHCRNCQTVTIVDNETLETMTRFKCSGCGTPMTTVRFAAVKKNYYEQLIQAFENPPFYGGIGPKARGTDRVK